MLVHKLKYKFSEPYRIKIGCGLNPIRNDREMRALIEFCRDRLKEDHIKLNLAKRDILEETIRLYEADDLELHYYINEHVEYYWS